MMKMRHGKEIKMWKRYRFKTKAVDDYRPLKFNPKYPWWCTGHGDNHVTIVAYLPIAEDLLVYWDDAYSVSSTVETELVFTDRFPKPKYFEE